MSKDPFKVQYRFNRVSPISALALERLDTEIKTMYICIFVMEID